MWYSHVVWCWYITWHSSYNQLKLCLDLLNTTLDPVGDKYFSTLAGNWIAGRTTGRLDRLSDFVCPVRD